MLQKRFEGQRRVELDVGLLGADAIGAAGAPLIPVAAGFRARLLGLALLDRADAGPGLLIPRCSSVHTFGMRFALDLHFLDAAGAVLAVRRAVPPCRFARRRGAAAVLELPATVHAVPASPEVNLALPAPVDEDRERKRKEA